MKSLIERGDLAGAKATLEAQFRSGRPSAEVYFLAGMIAVAEHKYRDAINFFRSALVYEPGSARLRLELGRAFYLAGDYRNAAFQFERALAGSLPAAVQSNVRRFLDLVRREQRWSYNVAFGIAPDTNINGGSTANQTILFGLPFQLGTNVRKHSGVGLDVGGSVEFRPHLSNSVRWKSGFAFRRRDYAGTLFDDTIASAWSGPEWFGKYVEVSLAATGLSRWYGSQTYQRAFGGRVDAIVYSGKRTAFVSSISGQDFRYATVPNQSGPVWSALVGVAVIVDPTTSVSLTIAAARQKARTADLSNTSALLSLSTTKDLPGGFTVTVAPTYAIANYDTEDHFFGLTRRDRSRELQVTLLNRRAVVWRFTPTITYTLFRRKSTIDLYRSSEDRFDIGVTSRF